MILSTRAREVLRKSSVVYAGDVGFHIPPGVDLSPDVQKEIETFSRHLAMPVTEAANAVIASLLESEGLPQRETPAVLTV